MSISIELHTYPEVYTIKNWRSCDITVTGCFETETEEHVIGIVKAHSTKSFVNKIIYKRYPKWNKFIVKGFWRIK